jgi:hypothetical protein
MTDAQITTAIENFTGKKVAEYVIDDVVYDWDEYCPDEHESEIDGNEGFNSQVAEWNDDGCDAETVVVFKLYKEEVTLLRQVGTKDFYDAWLPENAFGKGIWSDEEKLRMLRSKFYDTHQDCVKFVHVRYVENE